MYVFVICMFTVCIWISLNVTCSIYFVIYVCMFSLLIYIYIYSMLKTKVTNKPRVVGWVCL